MPPASTYRLQLSREFGFERAREVVPYLQRLGVDWVYLSPVLRATTASPHGYDVCDPGSLDPKLGTRGQFDAFSDAVRERDMGLLLDIVPNHMAASVENPWWRDVLVHGRGSRRASFFDIDWDARADGKLVLPVLDAPLDEALARGELTVQDDELVYFERRLPLAPDTHEGTVADVVARQHYRPDHWRLQASELNYRRFFDISDLVALRAELPEVFDASHAFVLELVGEGRVQGLRVDHVDGLRDPAAYLAQLQAAASAAAGTREFYVVVEKILHPTERLRDWPVAGTTGYDFVDIAEAPLAQTQHFAEAYASFCGDSRELGDVVAEAKAQIVARLFAGELARLARAVRGVLPELDADTAEKALVELTIALPVYRTYVDAGGAHDQDSAQVHELLRTLAVRDELPTVRSDAPHVAIAHALLREPELAMHWQQLTGPVAAKSVEDTAFYRWCAVPWRTEVGCEPDYHASVDEFHAAMARRLPFTLNAGSTHDSKRSEDVRARMMALAAPPHSWSLRMLEWARQLGEPPDRSLAWLALLTIASAWPIDESRLARYLTKAMREAKQRTSWTDVDEAFEAELLAWAERARREGPPADLLEHACRIGARTSLAALALRLFAPGVPDVYQGTELESLMLVDPDNRASVDFGARDRLLDSEQAPAKLRLLARGLRHRRDHAVWFAHAAYVPLEVPPGYVGFARESDGGWLAVVVPTVHAPAQPPVGGSALCDRRDLPRRWRHLVTGSPATLWLDDALGSFDVAVLVAGPDGAELSSGTRAICN